MAQKVALKKIIFGEKYRKFINLFIATSIIYFFRRLIFDSTSNG